MGATSACLPRRSLLWSRPRWRAPRCVQGVGSSGVVPHRLPSRPVQHWLGSFFVGEFRSWRFGVRSRLPSEDGSCLLTPRLRGSPPCSISDPRSVLTSPSPLDLAVSFASDLGPPLVPCLSPPDLGRSKYGRLSTCRLPYVCDGTCSSLRLASPSRTGASQRRIVGVQPSSVGLSCPVLNPLVRHSRRSHLLSFSFDSLGFGATYPAPGGTQNATCPSAQGASGANNESC